MKDKIKLPEDLKRRMLDIECLPDTISIKGRSYTPEKPAGSGYKSVVWSVKDEFGRMRALKLTITADYTDRSYLSEFYESSKLEPYNDVFAIPYDADLIKITLSDKSSHTFVGFVEEWIEGITLRAFLEKRKENVTVSFLMAYIRAMCQALNALDQINMCHDDLHMGNVMIASPAPGALSSDWRVKVIDTGSLKPKDNRSKERKDDHRHFVEHLVAIWNKIYARHPLSLRDRRFLSKVKLILNSMLDNDPARTLCDPRQILVNFETTYTRAQSTNSDCEKNLAHPFEFISAEHIPDDRLLVEIFARSCPWLEKVAGPDPCLVSGPRGCGKSTIFRWLSLKAHLHEPVSELNKLRISGFYISCSTDLQNRLGWIKDDSLAERFEKEIIHYFNLSIAREIVHTLELIAGRDEREQYWGFGNIQEIEVHRFILEAINSCSRTTVQGVSLMSQVREVIEYEKFDCHNKMFQGKHVKQATPATFLGDFTSLLVKQIPLFFEKKITFLLDDFSLHRLSQPVQIILNRVIWERRPSHVFKLSSEKYGAVITDSSGATVDITREFFDEIDCGREFIALDDKQQNKKARQFAEELLDIRLKKAGYKGKAKELIGESKWPQNSLARALIEKRHDRTADQYHGLSCIANLCSGDISTLLFLYNQIFIAGDVKKNSVSQVSKKIQHETIIKVSRRMFEHIRSHFPFGPQMYNIVSTFGSLSRKILEDGRWQKKGQSRVPTQCPRIEIDQEEANRLEIWTQENKDLALELIRRAIFIEMEPGLSRHKYVSTLRWQIRRIYLPAFYAPLSKNNAIKRDIEWFRFFLTSPNKACEMVWESWPREREASVVEGSLFRQRGNSNKK